MSTTVSDHDSDHAYLAFCNLVAIVKRIGGLVYLAFGLPQRRALVHRLVGGIATSSSIAWCPQEIGEIANSQHA